VTPSHILYIPMIALIGMFLGFILGARAARNSYDLERKRDEERAAARAERERKKAQRAEAAAAEKSPEA
jgi:hypothetical protein